MQLTIAQKALDSALDSVIRAVSGRSTLPILSNIALTAHGSTVTLLATDLEIAIEMSCDAEVSVEGVITLPAKTLAEIVGKFTGDRVTITLGEKNAVEIKCGRPRYTLLGLSPEEFPPLPEVAGDILLSFTAREIAQALGAVIHAVSTDDTRPILTGMLWDVRAGEVRFAATDTHRLAIYTLSHAGGAEKAMIVPARALTEVARFVRGGPEAESVSVRFDANQMQVATGRVRLTSRLIEGAFPRYERVVPVDFSAHLRVDTGELHAALHRVSIVAKENSGRVEFSFEDGILHLRAQAGDLGTAEEGIEATCEGEAVPFVLNWKYLADVTGAVGSGELVLATKEALTPLKITSEADERYLGVLMGMQL